MFKQSSAAPGDGNLRLRRRKYEEKEKDKLGLSCAKLRIVELKIEDKILGLNENMKAKILW